MRVRMKENVILQTKSFTSIYEIFRPKNVNRKATRLTKKKVANETPAADGNSKGHKHLSGSNECKPYVTSEKYHNLNKNMSYENVIRSSSTLFYDLDHIAIRHSFTDVSVVSYSNCLSNFQISNFSPNGFKGQSHAIVQECATQIKPKLNLRDSIEINSKKITKCFPNDPEFSSEIFLRDDDITDFVREQKSEKRLKRDQKYWSYAKYRTEYTSLGHQEKKSKKKERTRHIEDPCPCQLFSYTCPCTDNKSLTGLKNSKSLTDQITSTSNITKQDKIEKKETKSAKGHKGKKSKPKDDKPTSITCFTDNMDSFDKSDQPLDYSEKYKAESYEKSDQPLELSEKYELLQSIDNDADVPKSKAPSKRKRRILCPNCKEKIEIPDLFDQTEVGGSLKLGDSLFQMNDHAGKSIYTYKTSIKKHSLKSEGKEHCHHNPRCKLVPLCQILPTDNVFLNYKTIKKSETPKSSPRVIRVTKACRHHPPCTVAPSCQRANILKNNCEYIPPCLHRPRCVNLPLCVPFSKNIPYDELKHLDELENEECHHIPRCKFIPECQQDYGNLNNQIHIAQFQNTCGVLNDFQSYMQPAPLPNSFSPCQIFPPGYVTDYGRPKSEKSCQYDYLDCSVSRNMQESVSSEAVVFIRDVGCQFRNKYSSPKDSLRSTKSSILFDYDSLKLGSIYRNVHTLRYEDKCTNPRRKVEIETSSISLTSNYVPSYKYDDKSRPTGFDPKPATSPCVAYTTAPYITSQKQYLEQLIAQKKSKTHTVRSRISITSNKYRKMFSMKRKRKKRGESLLFFCRKSV